VGTSANNEFMAELRNPTGLTWCLDVNASNRSDSETLRRFGLLGWLNLMFTDTAVTEVNQTIDPDETDARMANLGFPMAMGPMVLGHSTLGYALLGSHGDGEALRSAFALMWPETSKALTCSLRPPFLPEAAPPCGGCDTARVGERANSTAN